MKRLIVLFLCVGFGGFRTAHAIAPAMPGVEVPQIIIERAQLQLERFMPMPALVNTMERYAEAKRLGLDDVDDIYAYSPVLCGKYSDSGPDDWPVADMQQQLFDGPWSTGTMAEYYEEISFNQFHLDGSVFGWYTSSLTQSYVVGSNYGFGPDAHVGEFLVELLDMGDPDIDFRYYDNDGPDNVPNSGDDDGIVDAMFFIHDGAGGETGAPNIWSHSYSLLWAIGYYYETDDPAAGGGNILVGPYIIQPSINSSGGMIEIGVFCHEFGHAIGLPDLYDTDYSSSGIGVWGLMGSGSWNTPAKPAHMICWCRYKMGWIEPVEVQTWLHNQPISVIELTGQAYRLWTEGITGPQYFMVENRQRYGMDINLMGEGLLIWHVDETAQQTNEFHPKVDMEEADGYDNLMNNVNSGDPGDPFPGSMDNHWFDEYTYPDSRDYYNNLTQVAVWNISDEADTIYANLDVVYSQPRLSLVGFAIDDSQGNGDGRADPGETVDLWITLENQWAAASNLTGIISSNSEYIEVVDSTGLFGYLPSQGTGSNQAFPFQLAVDPETPAGSWHDFEVLLSADGGFEQVVSFSIQVGRAFILLVDDDLGEDYQQFIAGAIEETNISYEIWDVSEQGSPADEIIHYGTVLWMTGDDDLTTLNLGEMSSLEYFLDRGRTLILTGQNINEDIGATAFFADYLKCTPLTNTVPNALLLEGVPENPLSVGMSLMLFGVGGAYNQTSPSSVVPLEPAQPLFTYANGEVAGINYEDPASGAHVVYLAFGLEAVSGMAGTTTQAQVLASISEWAMITPVESDQPRPAPSNWTLNQNYPNPFNPETSIGFALPKAEKVKLGVYDLSGRLVATLVDGWLQSGYHEVTFVADGLSSGVYLYRLQAGEFTSSAKMVLMK